MKNGKPKVESKCTDKVTVLINGHPNSGKSTLVKALKKRLRRKGDFYDFDYDLNFIKLAQRCSADDHNCLRGVKAEILEGIEKGSEKVNLISDVLISTRETFRLAQSIKQKCSEVCTIRLYCNQEVREKRDLARKKANPDAPDGFNHALNPESSIIVYDLDIDTSTRTINDICQQVMEYLKSKGIKSI